MITSVDMTKVWPRLRCRGFTGCWEWQGYLEHGYGKMTFWVDGGNTSPYIHRLTYVHFRGPIPDGLQIDHLCRNRACANPAHLEVVTAQENLLRGDTGPGRNARKTECWRGHPFDAENTYVTRSGARQCRACMRIRDRKRRPSKTRKGL